MIIWGAIWGALISVLVSRHSGDWEWIVGALFGALAGWTLRKAVRSEVTRLTRPSVSQAAAPTVAATTASKVATLEPVAPVVASAQPMTVGAVVAASNTASLLPALNDSPNLAASATEAMPPIAPVATAPAPEPTLKASAKPDAVALLVARAKS